MKGKSTNAFSVANSVHHEQMQKYQCARGTTSLSLNFIITMYSLYIANWTLIIYIVLKK
jgi:hypothetical protein